MINLVVDEVARFVEGRVERMKRRFYFESPSSFGGPRVAFEDGSHEIGPGFPLLAGIGSGVDADEAIAGFNEIEKSLTLGLVEEDFVASGVIEKDGVVLREVLRGELFGVVGAVDCEGFGGLAHFFKSRDTGGDRAARVVAFVEEENAAGVFRFDRGSGGEGFFDGGELLGGRSEMFEEDIFLLSPFELGPALGWSFSLGAVL